MLHFRRNMLKIEQNFRTLSLMYVHDYVKS